MPGAAPKPYLAAGTLALAAASLSAAAAPFSNAALLLAGCLLLLGWFLLTAVGLLLFYQPAFLKREAPGADLTRGLLVLPLAGVAAFLAAPLLQVDGERTLLVLAGFTAVAFALLFGGFALVGRREKRAPLHRNGSPYEGGDRAVVLGFALAYLASAAGGALLIAFPAPDSPGARLLALGAIPLFLMSAAYHLFPRVAKRPLAAPALAAAATLLQAAGAAGVALAPLLRIPTSLLPVYGVAIAIALLHLVAATAGAFLRLPARAGPQSEAAKPLALAATPFLLAGGLLLAVPGAPVGVAAPFLAGGFALLFTALSYLLMPVVLNQVPWSRRLPLALAALLGAAVPLAALAAAGRVPPGSALALAALAGLLHVANLVPMARPRRECPPDPA